MRPIALRLEMTIELARTQGMVREGGSARKRGPPYKSCTVWAVREAEAAEQVARS